MIRIIFENGKLLECDNVDIIYIDVKDNVDVRYIDVQDFEERKLKVVGSITPSLKKEGLK